MRFQSAKDRFLIKNNGREPRRATTFASNRWDLLAIGMLVATTGLAWCVATRKTTSAEWRLPTTYSDPSYSDFVGTCAIFKSHNEAHLWPFAWKVVPMLGAPEAATWNLSPTPDETLIGFFGACTWALGLFPGINLGVLIGHIAAALVLYLVARTWIQAMPAWSFVMALAFGLSPYLFAEEPHHLNCQYVWHLPLFSMVWTWASTAPGLQWRSRRFWQSIAVGFVTGLLNPYFSYIFCQLTLLGGASLAWRTRSWRAIAPAAMVVGAAAAAFFLSELDTLTYRMAHSTTGAVGLVAQREYRWMDIYGFKIVDLFIPSFTHHSSAFANFGLAHRQASALNDEEGCAYLGLLGIGCLLFLVISTVRALLDGKLAAVPIQAWWILWIVLFFNTGGFNSLIASYTGFTLFRTATRYSVVVLVIVLLYAAQRLSAWQRDAASRYPADVLKIGTLTAAVAASLLLLWDQVPRGPTAENTALIATLVDSDRAFVDRLEQALPERAMIFQLPVMDGTPVPGVATHDHYRPYLYSTRLHWSHGALPGSKTLQWQQSVQKQLVEGAAVDQQAQQVRFDIGNVRRAVDEMTRRGFVAIYLNRNGFPDRGKGLIDALLEMGFTTPPIYSATGDLTCILLGDRPTAAK